MTPRPRRCDTYSCRADPIEPVLNPTAIDQSTGTLPAWVFDCTCGWKRIEPVATEPAARIESNGWTASHTPCRRETDVVPR